MIQLRSVSKELCNKTDFHIAVPGTYKPDKPVILIKYFVGRFSVYATKQQPKIICIIGDDGKFYQYLLKGHEDLRLDERLMQFFKLINSLVKKNTSQNSALIQTMSVIPLSLFHGLVQWVKGTDTIKEIVQANRNLHGKNPNEEFVLMNQFLGSGIDDLLPIQRMQVNLKIFSLIPDTDISNFLWLKAENADLWMKQTTTFSVSSAIMSIVGYVIGLGDRHPSNLLIDKSTGKVVHIDFGDSFERAAKRKVKPEIVPFRLTRMMVRALGMTGVDGPFKNAFINMSQLLRENRRVLLMILAIFVHEPLVDPDNLNEEARFQNASNDSSQDDSESPTRTRTSLNDDTSSGMKKSRSVSASKKRTQFSILRSTSKSNFGISFHLQEEEDIEDAVSNAEAQDRVKLKLAGRDFEPGVSLSVEEQATRLIQKATDVYNLSKMFSGWFPYW